MNRLIRFLSTSEGVMALVIVMYLVKVVTKVGFGQVMHSPMIEGDGWHNASDIFQAMLVIAGVRLARRPASGAYPLGLRGLDALGTLAIGLSLGYAAVFEVLVPSMAGVLAAMGISGMNTLAPPTSGLSSVFGAVIGALLMLGSAIVSWFVSRHQIRVGRETGHASVVADGEETLGDGKIEAVAAAGIVIQALLHLVWLEYVLGLLIFGIMAHTAWEILTTAMAMLLNKGLGESQEAELCSAVTRVYGIDKVARLVTYRRGPCVVVEIVAVTRLGARGRDLMRTTVIKAIRTALSQEEGGEASVLVTFTEPEVHPFRRGYLVRQEGNDICVVGSLTEATHLLIAEVEHGVNTEWETWPITAETLRSLLVEKHVLRLYVYVPDGDLAPFNEHVVGKVGVKLAPASSLSLLGLPA